MKQIRKTLFTLGFLCLILSLFTTNTAKAEVNFNASQMSISKAYLEILPEYNAPRPWPEAEPPVLIFYRVTMKNETGSKYEGEIEIPVPSDVKNFQVVDAGEYKSEDDANGDSQKIPYELDEKRNILSVKPSKAIEKDAEYFFAFSYVMSPMEVTDTKKFNFDFVTNVDIDVLDVNLYLPINARDYEVNPKADHEQVNADGERYYQYHKEQLTAEEPIEFAVSYIRPENTFTVDLLSEENVQEMDESQNTGGATVSTALIIACVIVIFGIIVFFGLRGSGQSRQQEHQVERGRATKHSGNGDHLEDNIQNRRKKLRNQLLAGEIDEEQYHREMNKLK